MISSFTYRGVTVLILALVSSACRVPGNSTPSPYPAYQPSPNTALATVGGQTADSVFPTLDTTMPVPIQTTAAPVPGVTQPDLVYLDMVEPQVGWGWTGQSVLHTLDGGQTWEDVTPQNGFIASGSLSGAFLDASTGWVLVPAADVFSGTLFRTQDSGRTWQPAQVPFSGASYNFLDKNLGWAMVSTGAAAGSAGVDIYQTTDSGANWTRLYSLDPSQPELHGGLPFSGAKNGIGFASSTRGWVGGAQPMDGYVWLFATEDGGRSWQHQDLALPAGFEQAMTSVDAPLFFDPLEGVLPVQLFLRELAATVFYHTRDGGLSWQASRPVTLTGPYSVASPDDFFVWDGQTLVASDDGGQTWQSIPTDLYFEDSLSQIDFVAPAQGWAIGMDASGVGSLYQTMDGGFSWIMPGERFPYQPE